MSGENVVPIEGAQSIAITPEMPITPVSLNDPRDEVAFNYRVEFRGWDIMTPADREDLVARSAEMFTMRFKELVDSVSLPERWRADESRPV